MASGKSLMQLSRCALSTQSVATKMVKPPVPMFGIGGRYATALYSAASKKNKLEQVDKNLKTLLELHEKDVKFRDFLLNPLIKVSVKKIFVVFAIDANSFFSFVSLLKKRKFLANLFNPN